MDKKKLKDIYQKVRKYFETEIWTKIKKRKYLFLSLITIPIILLGYQNCVSQSSNDKKGGGGPSIIDSVTSNNTTDAAPTNSSATTSATKVVLTPDLVLSSNTIKEGMPINTIVLIAFGEDPLRKFI
ncbi:MAG: hypothetical protein HQK49_19050 [Oligoflexia bacterium]|nr:hypothetical protein [Oligoflexia bacterium]